MIRMIWNTLYTKPKNWLCGLQTDKVLHFVVSKEKVDADDMWADIFGVCAGVITLVVYAAMLKIYV
jgi:hypothetical protein